MSSRYLSLQTLFKKIGNIMTACSEYSLLYLHVILVNFILEVLQCLVLVQTATAQTNQTSVLYLEPGAV